MTDKNFSEMEQRLFLLLDTVEKQAEDNAKLQRLVYDIACKLDKKTDRLDAVIDDKLAVAEKKIDVTQKRFDNIVYLSAKHLLEQNFPTLLENVIRENADFSQLENSLNNAVKSLDEQVNGNSSMYSVLHNANIKKTKEVSAILDYQKDKLMKNQFKWLAIITSGIFAIFFLFFWIMYAVTVPTQEHLQSLKQEKIQLMTDINQLKINRAEWIKDAQKNGYFKR